MSYTNNDLYKGYKFQLNSIPYASHIQLPPFVISSLWIPPLCPLQMLLKDNGIVIQMWKYFWKMQTKIICEIPSFVYEAAVSKTHFVLLRHFLK